jgi:UDP-2,3-diacylglucosamine pyrophosphatase LpxH
LDSLRIIGHPKARRHRAIWISDVHLGTRACRADLLLDFLRHNDADVIYLVGDIVDGWEMAKSWYWPQSHNDVIQKILRKARKGASVIYVPGNHDCGLRPFAQQRFGDIHVVSEHVHHTADGRKLWVIHGDAFDAAVRFPAALVWLGDRLYETATALNIVVAAIRRRLGLPHWSLAAHLKRNSRRAAAYIEAYERAVVAEARRRGMDGAVCGHIHTVATKMVDGILYANDGDWVENCSALVEDHDGRISVIRWPSVLSPAEMPAPVAALPKTLIPTGA